jgi:hypothetical protein
MLRRFNYIGSVRNPAVKVATILDVSTIIVVPDEPDNTFAGVDEKMIFQCMFFYPHILRFSEVRGIRVRLQDSFFRIRENRHLAWVCVEFSRLLFSKLTKDIEMKIMSRSYNQEPVVRLYTKEFDVIRLLGNIYEEYDGNHSPINQNFYRQHMETCQYQEENFNEVCINDVLSLYSRFVIELDAQAS